MSFRSWASVITLLLLALVIYFSWPEIVRAKELLGQVNLWILALLIPVQILVYFAAGEMVFSYLRRKKAISHIPPAEQGIMALELNFVNHTLPSAGVSGISYMTWRLSKLGISPARATAAQLVRYVTGFAAFVALLIVALIAITLDGEINRGMILISGLIVTFMIGGTIGLVFIVGSQRRIERFAAWATRTINLVVRKLTLGKRKRVIKSRVIIEFFTEIHDEYLILRRDRKSLLAPFLWGLAFNALDVLLFVITFWALGTPVNPAPILIAYGLASIAGFIVITPGGAGAYEAIMVSFLATAGIPAGTAIAGILLTRIAVLAGTIILGYLFYQRTLLKYGRAKS